MSDIEAIAEKVRGKLAGADLGGSVSLDLGDDGIVHISESGEVTTGGGDADCTISCSVETLEELAGGGLDPTMAFMQGKLKIAGDMGLAMKLAPMLS